MNRQVFVAVTAALTLSACAVPVDHAPKGMPKVLMERAGEEVIYPGHAETTAAMSAEDFRGRIAALSDDRFEGRLPGTAPGEASADWIAEEMRRIGLKPGNGNSYFQDVPAASTQLDASASLFEIATPTGKIAPKFADEVAYWTPRFDKVEQRVEGSDIVFAGYGVVAPEHNWNDYAGIDAKGKTVVVLINDPGFVTRDASLFKGKAMTYYGRWTYKFEEAARQGAAAVIIVHETEPAAYGWQVVRNSNTGAKLYLDRPNGNSDWVTVQSWVTEDTAKSIFSAAGLDYGALRLAANKRGFKPVPMTGLKLNARTVSAVNRFTTRNVLGMVRGRSRPGEYVLYTAHWDHLGVKENAPGPDKIHNGAVDNATGVSAVLEIGEAFAKARRAPRRSVMIAAVTLEEQGLLGSEYLASHPPVPLRQIAGGINIDGMLPIDRSLDMEVVGSGASELEPILSRALRAQGRTATPDPNPERGSFYRSDHISLAKRGVPMLYAGGGENLRVGGHSAGKAAADDYRANRYHQPADGFDPRWDVSGPMEDIAVLYETGRQVAQSRRWPNWFAGNEFRAIRDADRAQAGAQLRPGKPVKRRWKGRKGRRR